MSQANEKAEAILIVIKRILKWIAITVAVIVGAITIFVQYSDWASERREKARFAKEDKVVVKALYPEEKDCQEGYPYLYTVVNNTNQTVRKVTFQVEITKKGFSKVLNSRTEIEEDKILKPNEGYGRCFRATSEESYSKQVTEKDVVINITRKSVEFEGEQEF
jgi:hypothetical protein